MTSTDSRYFFAKEKEFSSEDAINFSADAEDATKFTGIQGSVSKEKRSERLENSFVRLFGTHLSPHAMRLGAVFVRTS